MHVCLCLLVYSFSHSSHDITCTAAPTATASSGFTVRHKSSTLPEAPKKARSWSWSASTRVEPPTSTQSETCWTNDKERKKKSR